MKVVLTVSVALVSVLLFHSAGSCHGFGAGIIVGEPTGVCFKQWLNYRNAIDFAAAWSFDDEAAFQFHMDYLFHKYFVIITDRDQIVGGMPLSVGIGGRLKLEDDDEDDDDVLIGVRFPLGISYLFVDTPVDLFLEVVPIMDLAPETDFSLNGAIGFRYYF